MHVTESEKETANSVNVLDYLQSIGEPLVEEGSLYFRHKDHDSLVINGRKNYFSWNSRNVSGNAVTYLMYVYGMPFQDAVKQIVDDIGNKGIEKYERKEPLYKDIFKYEVKESSQTNIIRDYLVNERKVDADIVNNLIEHDFIKEDVYQNVVFKWRDENGIIGANLQGTRLIPEEKRLNPDRAYFKHVFPTTEEDTFNGFNITRGYPENLYFFESAIDMLSYFSLNRSKLTNCRLTSMDGLKPKTVLKVMQKAIGELNQVNKDLSSICYCVDNDKAGREFIKKMSGFKYKGVEVKQDIPDLPIGQEKWDWNNELKHRKSELVKTKDDMTINL